MTEAKPQFSPLYAGYYNLIYRNKDYAGEAQFVLDRAKAHGLSELTQGKQGSILDLGSGTGRHAFQFQKKGFSVHGIDLSENMVEVAKAAARDSGLGPNDVYFESGDIRRIALNRKFNLVVSLFHVMSYQTTNDDLRQTLTSVRKHLDPGGLFVFDFWYGPTVLNLKPQAKLLQLEDEDFRIARQTLPEHFPDLNVVNVRFELDVEQKSKNQKERFIENHRMRYLFIPELEAMLKETGFSLQETGEWISTKPLGIDTWNGYLVARAV